MATFGKLFFKSRRDLLRWSNGFPSQKAEVAQDISVGDSVDSGHPGCPESVPEGAGQGVLVAGAIAALLCQCDEFFH